MFRKVFSATVIVSLFLTIYAAEVTEVASSFDYKNPFDFNLNMNYVSTHHYGSIKREYNSIPTEAFNDVNNIPFFATTDRRVETKEYSGNPELLHLQKLLIDAEIGLYHNLSLSFFLPVILSEKYKMVMYDPPSSSSKNNLSLAEQELFPWSGNLDYTHKGVGDIAFGLQWAPFSEERKNRFMSWLLGINITFPTASVKTPEGMNKKDKSGNNTRIIVPSGKSGNVGEGVFRFDFRTAVSKKYSVAEPYFQLMFSLPVNSSKSIYKDPKEAVFFNIGTDFNFWENKKHGQRVKMRTDIEIGYTNKGNAYNVITDARWIYDDVDAEKEYGWTLPAGEDNTYNILPVEDSWVQIAGMLKLSVRAYKYVELGGFLEFGYRHKHYLTNAKEGFAGYIEGLDSEKTSWLSDSKKDSDPRSRSGGRLLAEQYLMLDWGFNLKLLF